MMNSSVLSCDALSCSLSRGVKYGEETAETAVGSQWAEWQWLWYIEIAMHNVIYCCLRASLLVLMTRGWFDCFFMSSAFFAINAFVLKYIWCPLSVSACSFLVETTQTLGNNTHLCTLMHNKHITWCSPLGFYSCPLENHIISCTN